MEEIVHKHHLKIYIDNVNCDPREPVSCPRSIIVSYNSLVITLKNHNLIGAAKLEVRFNIRTSWVKIQQSALLIFSQNKIKKSKIIFWNSIMPFNYLILCFFVLLVSMQALMGDKSLKLPFTENNVRVVSSGLNLILEIPKLKVVVMFGINGFSVNLPFEHFGDNTQGHCGM